MKKVNIFLIGVSILGGLMFSFSMKSEAATLEEMKENIEGGDGLVYNPISEGIMDHEGSVEFVKSVESLMVEENSTEITDAITDQAFEETSLETTIKAEVPLIKGVTPYVATPPGPNSYYNLTGKQYRSNPFTGSGWQYSGYRFKFADGYWNANPFYGVRAEGDSFYFATSQIYGTYDIETVIVPANGSWIYVKSGSSMGYGGYYGVFSTLNPARNSRYAIHWFLK